MARSGKLTALKADKLKKPGLYGDGGNLYLQVTAELTKSWIFRFTPPGGGGRRDMGLGSFDTYGLAEAREQARAQRKMLAEGKDPIEQRRARRMQEKLDAVKAITFKECAERLIAAQQAGWSNRKHAAQWRATLETYVYRVVGDLPVQSVDVGLVMKVLEPIWQNKPETASRVRGRIEAVLDWAKARGYRDGENPARWRGHLDQLLPKKTKVAKAVRAAKGRGEHHAAMPFAEVPVFMVELRQQEGIAANALEFAILCGARTGEVLGAKWDEINLTERLWTVPAERMKTDKEHRVPLSDTAITVLGKMAAIRQGEFLFPGGRTGGPLSNMSMLMTLRRMGRGDLTAHGFRSSFRDWAAERTGFPTEVAEMALAHAVGDKVEAAYRRGDLFQKRRQLMDAWARFCADPVPAGRVLRFVAAK
jgi:integrase